jgi:hypothetical protein
MVVLHGAAAWWLKATWSQCGVHYDDPNQLELAICRPSSAQAGWIWLEITCSRGSRHAAVGTKLRWRLGLQVMQA